MATVTEFVILATGWKYQQVVCVPKGMAVLFFGIGPIGATILAVELLKLPLAIWTASRRGLQKALMIMIGLPLICLLTFQLVKDMAVYEMGVALAPASQLLEQAMTQEDKIAQLQGELDAIAGKKGARNGNRADLEAQKARAEADFQDALKRNQAAHDDAVNLTDYQKSQLAEVTDRETTMIRQFDADAADLTKSIADLNARREIELGRATAWNAEEARIDNAYKTKMADYTNKKNAYEAAKTAYDNANFITRALMSKPVDPGVPPVPEENTILKPTAVTLIENQIKDKEAELLAVNTERRNRVAQVENDADALRAEFDHRSTTKREEADRKHDELLAAYAAQTAQFAAEEKQIDQNFDTTASSADGIRAQLADCQKQAEVLYEQRETAIKNTQVFRIATTVEIIRGLLMGQHPVSIKATAKERGDLYTDQISMVRIWVYPVLAFIVAFLPTLLVEIGFSTIFHPEKERPKYRLGFFGRRLHELYIRAGRQKIARAIRLANHTAYEINVRDRALAEKEGQLQRQEAAHMEQLVQQANDYVAKAKASRDEWVAKLASMADSLNRMVLEKDALRDLQKTEVDRQIQMRQNAWQDRVAQLSQELDNQRTAAETERTALMQEHHKKLMEVTEDAKNQVIKARRQVADAEMAAVESTAKLAHDLKDAVHARDVAEAELQKQSEFFSVKSSQAKEDAAREVEKAVRLEKHRFERQQLEFNKTLRQREEDFDHQLKQREQELAIGFDARQAAERERMEQEGRLRQVELDRQLAARVQELDARWKQDVAQREEAAQNRLKQREQQLQSLAEARLGEVQRQSEQESHHQELELQRQLENQAREADTRLKQELQQKELAFATKLKQREQELIAKADTRETELRTQLASDLRARREEWEREADARIRASEIRFQQEAQQKDEAAQDKARQREQDLIAQLTSQSEARHLALLTKWEAESEKKTRAATEPLKEMLVRAEKERDEARQLASEGRRQLQNMEKKLAEASSFLNGWGNGKVLAGVD
jgi:DNA-binding transcriptional regulator YdaS (Cro superfamily)